MERRDFIKTGLFAMFALYGFPENVLSSKLSDIRKTGLADAKSYRLKGVYAGTITDNRVLMPEMLSRPLRDENLYLFAADTDKTIFLIPENSAEWKAVEQIFHTMDKKDVLHFRRQLAKLDKEGRLDLPARMRKFAGIQKPTITITGQGNTIRIDGAETPSS
jgi:DNA-binding transcriptional regulator/RsmH inhibitor MraZ